MTKRPFLVIPHEFVVPARVLGQRVVPVWLSKVRWVVLRGSKTPIMAVYRQVEGFVSDENPIKVMILGDDTSVRVAGEKGMVMISSRVRRNDTWVLGFDSGGQRRRMYELVRTWIELGRFLQSLVRFTIIAKSRSAVVYRCHDRNNTERVYALKRVDRIKYWNEIETTERIANVDSLQPFIPRFLFMFEDNKDNTVTIVMQYYRGGSLADRINASGPMAESTIRNVIVSLCCALYLLHENRILHLDVKASNVLFDADAPHSFDNLKLVDYGSSTVWTGDTRLQVNGTYGCMAPERFEGRYGPESDVYGAGIILYHMVVGETPFQGSDSYQIMMKNMEGTVPFPHAAWQRVSQPLRELTERMLEKDPDRRISIRDILRNKWLFRNPTAPNRSPRLDDLTSSCLEFTWHSSRGAAQFA